MNDIYFEFTLTVARFAVAFALLCTLTAWAIWKCRQWRGMLALLSGLVATTFLILFVASWHNWCYCNSSWSLEKGGGWTVYIWSSRGEIRTELQLIYKGGGNGRGVGRLGYYPGQAYKYMIPAQPVGLLKGIPFIQNKLGFVIYSDRAFNGSSNTYFAVIPHWMILSLTPLFPLLWLRAFRRRRHRTKNDLCLSCGYDMRATPAKCPECGWTPPAPKPADAPAPGAQPPST